MNVLNGKEEAKRRKIKTKMKRKEEASRIKKKEKQKEKEKKRRRGARERGKKREEKRKRERRKKKECGAPPRTPAALQAAPARETMFRVWSAGWGGGSRTEEVNGVGRETGRKLEGEVGDV